MTELSIPGSGLALSATRGGGNEGPVSLVMLHGLTATRHYTVMGSRHLDRRGIANLAYDARGHGLSGAAACPQGYTYDALSEDLLAVVRSQNPGGEPVTLLGISMGSHTAVHFAIEHPELVAGLLLITPAYLPGSVASDRSAWDELAAALRGPDPIDAFVAASHLETLPPEYRDQVGLAIRQRIGRHANLPALADALDGVPGSVPFASMDDLTRIAAPTIVVGSRDEVDPSHPLAVAQRWTEAIPGARIEVEEEGKSPLAWQGGRLARLAEELVDGARV